MCQSERRQFTSHGILFRPDRRTAPELGELGGGDGGTDAHTHRLRARGGGRADERAESQAARRRDVSDDANGDTMALKTVTSVAIVLGEQ